MRKYNLSDSEIRQIANLAVQENGESAVADEVSLMANLFELQSKYSSIYSYIRNGGWFSRAAYFMDNGSSSSSARAVVKDVLVNGNRTLPAYVNEHDCFGDITSVTNNGKAITKTNRSQYIKDVTIIKNRYGSTYTFYKFPTPYSDPFGYTASAYNKLNGKDGTVPSGSTVLRVGSTGDAVAEMQEMLTNLSYDCKGIDGDFGSNTFNALKAFQKAYKLEVDGIYGAESKKALEAAYKAKNTLTDAQQKWLKAVAAVATKARTENWTYGDSRAMPPCSDGKISCDRIIARALYDLGFTDQPTGGITCGNVEEYLPKFGFKKILKKKNIKPGAVIAVRRTNHNYIDHVFVVKSYNKNTDMCDKYDTGSNERIKYKQPYKNVKLVEWSDRVFVSAWNVPDDLTPPKKSSGWKAIGTATSTRDDLPVRKEPNGEILMKLGKGNRFEVDGVINGNWVHVKAINTIGYVHKKYVKYD